MRSLVRIGVLLGVPAAIVFCLLAPAIGVAALLGVAATGLLAGLACAKWLPWSWYGRQTAAGLRTGAIAGGLAALGMLAGLLGSGPHQLAALAARSRIGGVALDGGVTHLAFAGWAGVDILAAAGGVALAVALAAAFAWLFAASKSASRVAAVERAHATALALNPPTTWIPAPHSQPSTATVMGGIFSGGALAASSGLAAPVSGGQYPAITPSDWRSLADSPLPASAFATGNLSAGALPQATLPDTAAQTTPAMPAIPHERGNHISTDAHPLRGHISNAMREALAAWAAANDDEQPAQAAPQASAPRAKKRSPQPSAFLNQQKRTAVAKRARKKQDTQDWLC